MRNRSGDCIFVIFLLLVFCSCQRIDDAPPTIKPTERNIFLSDLHLGINYEPFHHDGQHPGTPIPLAQIREDLTTIGTHFRYFRTYTIEDNMDQVIPIAHEFGLQVALGIRCHPGDTSRTRKNIDRAVDMAVTYSSTVACLVIGNEMNIKNDTNYVPAMQVKEYMEYARLRMSGSGVNLPITSCITGGGADPDYNDPTQEFCGVIMQACRDLNEPENRVILLTMFPYWGQYYSGKNSPENIAESMTWSYEHGIKQARLMYDVCTIIGEIGWPSASFGISTNRENKVNAGINFQATLHWLTGNNKQYQAFNGFWYTMFDQPWKVSEPNEVGPHWGIYEKNGNEVPKFIVPVIR